MNAGEDGRERLESAPRKEERREQSKEGIIDERRFFFLLKIVSSLLFFSILQMVSHVFNVQNEWEENMADVGYS